MDDADYVYDEIPDNLWNKIFQFCVPDITDDTVYNIDNCTVCNIYRDNFHL